MNKQEIFQLSNQAIKNAEEQIISVAKTLWENPETGFREVKSSALLVKILEDLGFKVKTGLAVTGFRADLDTGKPGPTIAVMGEYDALLIPSHPEAVNGVAHACGHNTSAAGLIGTAIGLKAAVASGELCGKIAFIGTPAEEGIELEFRQQLIDEGKIKSIAGKPQLIREGVFDDVDIAFMHHLSTRFGYNSHNGSLCKKIIFRGKSCHAAAPQNGTNALNAMNLALHALGLLRESYSASDKVRFHGIVSNGGQSVNIIPDQVEMDYMLRAETVQELVDLNKRFDNAVTHAALAAECSVNIKTIPYSMPVIDDEMLGEELGKVVNELFPGETYNANGFFLASCTDMGDVETVIPSVHGYVPGAIGASHSKDYFVNNYYTGCIYPALIGSRIIIELLHGNAEKGKAIAARKADLMPIPEYIKLLDSLSTEKSAAPEL